MGLTSATSAWGSHLIVRLLWSWNPLPQFLLRNDFLAESLELLARRSLCQILLFCTRIPAFPVSLEPVLAVSILSVCTRIAHHSRLALSYGCMHSVLTVQLPFWTFDHSQGTVGVTSCGSRGRQWFPREALCCSWVISSRPLEWVWFSYSSKTRLIWHWLHTSMLLPWNKTRVKPHLLHLLPLPRSVSASTPPKLLNQGWVVCRLHVAKGNQLLSRWTGECFPIFWTRFMHLLSTLTASSCSKMFSSWTTLSSLSETLRPALGAFTMTFMSSTYLLYILNLNPFSSILILNCLSHTDWLFRASRWRLMFPS